VMLPPLPFVCLFVYPRLRLLAHPDTSRPPHTPCFTPS
jgi:hypothetical protein